VTWANAIKSALWVAFTGALLFLSAGTLDWPGAWTFLAEFVIGSVAIMWWLKRHDPELLRERTAGLFQRDQPFSDKVFMATLVVMWHSWLVLMGLDAGRWHISHTPEWLSVVGALLIAVGLFVVWLVFRANSFAAPVIKIQEDRGQRVVSTGPYGIVRHPMYTGVLIYLLGMPLLLGSWLGLLVLPLIVGALVVRIFIEEATLRDGLPGYAEYADRVRYRLIPGVW
jgi:protein-S-isoprenylcysteine O-methyltransferase Ste14